MHSGGGSLGETHTLLKRWPWRLGSPCVFPARPVFPFLYHLVDGKSTNKEVSTWIGLREIEERRHCSVAWSLLLGHCVDKGLLVWFFPGQFSPLAPDLIPRTCLFYTLAGHSDFLCGY